MRDKPTAPEDLEDAMDAAEISFMSDAELDRELTQLGLDPGALARRALALATGRWTSPPWVQGGTVLLPAASAVPPAEARFDAKGGDARVDLTLSLDIEPGRLEVRWRTVDGFAAHGWTLLLERGGQVTELELGAEPSGRRALTAHELGFDPHVAPFRFDCRPATA